MATTPGHSDFAFRDHAEPPRGAPGRMKSLRPTAAIDGADPQAIKNAVAAAPLHRLPDGIIEWFCQFGLGQYLIPVAGSDAVGRVTLPVIAELAAVDASMISNAEDRDCAVQLLRYWRSFFGTSLECRPDPWIGGREARDQHGGLVVQWPVRYPSWIAHLPLPNLFESFDIEVAGASERFAHVGY